MFSKSREENERQADAEKKKLEKEAMKERPCNLPLKKDVADCDKAKGLQLLKHIPVEPQPHPTVTLTTLYKITRNPDNSSLMELQTY
ncbi:hypothetical protein K2173_021782 [Erythroxylum novogranatense]|uniref:Uncharacterized protein n=1 Tax=Erythroxylum novogranatense TaxID=1862640 RepID=A0AAV8TVE7_9ROSI|nr:hypothetical protein K2173_021782 [Erythroxylum novogranatense]